MRGKKNFRKLKMTKIFFNSWVRPLALPTIKMSHTSRTRHSAVTIYANKTTCYFPSGLDRSHTASVSSSCRVLPLPCLRLALPLHVRVVSEKNFSCLLLLLLLLPSARPLTSPSFACASTNTQLLSAKMEMLT